MSASVVRMHVILLLVTLFAAGCEKKLGEACSAPSDCRKGLACLSGECQRCQSSPGCAESGKCGSKGGKCYAANDSDCKHAKVCKTDGRCKEQHGRCVDKVVEHVDPDNREGGCPCGCDRSEEMTAELGQMSAPRATGLVASALHTIAEREEAGYITDAMVEHRLRLLGLGSMLPIIDTPGRKRSRFLSLSTLFRRAERHALAATESAELKVRHEWLVFGQTSETVNGHDKRLPACFRLWLEIENRTGHEIVLQRPSIRASVPLEVRRWYLEHEAGVRWDGRLGARDKETVLVIGYLDAAVPPGTPIDGQVSLSSMAIGTHTVALGRWDAALGGR